MDIVKRRETHDCIRTPIHETAKIPPPSTGSTHGRVSRLLNVSFALDYKYTGKVALTVLFIPFRSVEHEMLLRSVSLLTIAVSHLVQHSPYIGGHFGSIQFIQDNHISASVNSMGQI